MEPTRILFHTDRFNLSEVGPDFINDICFGEDFGNWLRAKLNERNVEIEDFGQEDWGWLLIVRHNTAQYFLAINGESEDKAGRPNFGQWSVVVERRLSLKEKLMGAKGPDTLAGLVEQILREEPDFSEVMVEA